MRQASGLVLVLLLSCRIVSAQTEPAMPSVELPPQLDRVLRDYEGAWRARDPQRLAGLFTEDGFVMQNGRPPARGRDQIVAAYTGHGGPLALRALAFSTDGSVAYIVGAYAGAAGKPDDGKFVLAVRRIGDRWLIAADMDNSNRRPSAAAASSPPQ